MKKIGITGSLASGKTTASKLISNKRGPLFSADQVVKKLYKKKNFKSLISKKLKIDKKNIKKILRRKILEDKSYIEKLEKIIHPLVRKEMRRFVIKNKHKKFLFFEIPLLIENKLMHHFDLIIFIKARKNLRLKRFRLKGGSKKLFEFLNNKQLTDLKKIKHCDHVAVNEKNIKILRGSLLDIISQYE